MPLFSMLSITRHGEESFQLLGSCVRSGQVALVVREIVGSAWRWGEGIGRGAVCSTGRDLSGLTTLLELEAVEAKQGCDWRLSVSECPETTLLLGLTEVRLCPSKIFLFLVILLFSCGDTLLNGCTCVLLCPLSTLINDPCSEGRPFPGVLLFPTRSWVTSIIFLFGFYYSCTQRWWIQSTYSFYFMVKLFILVLSCCQRAVTRVSIFYQASRKCRVAFQSYAWQCCQMRLIAWAQFCLTCPIPLSSYFPFSFCSIFLSNPSLSLSTIFFVSLTTICIFFSISNNNCCQWLQFTCGRGLM